MSVMVCREYPAEAISKGHLTSVINHDKSTNCEACVDEYPLEQIIPDYLYET